ncbi:helix-turn-helix domain-containing protein [Pedobacter nyackensis]|uniref:Zn-dependent peptidase ImmA, M78 family n=1 Tax=Pedobacter nyackensis TaxID=475255 RepID=A0A1W2AI02_9SPHI|nr:XRE family transcriptional regulator [Pedobacter nyackensis]SMC60071.1 Zn-dependent peptidase ImmA, M78 family [Pedobacter nyackensis]
MNNLFAERFKSARLMNGFSLQDLSDKLNKKISRQALHKYEKGEVIPDSVMLGLLCEALSVRPDYFFRDAQVQLGNIEFRKLKKLPAKEEHKILEHAKDYLSRYLELEQLLNIETKFSNPLEGMKPIKSFDDVEEAAIKVREIWGMGIGAIASVVELLEDKHIKVMYINAGNDYDGMQTMVLGNNVPVIAINENKVKKEDRKRFTAMHELAHLLLNIQDDLPEKEKEIICHQFAGAILFPADALRNELGNQRTKIHLQELGALKKEYGISMQAIIMRAKDLKIISDNYCKQLFTMFKQMNWRVDEPVSYEVKETSNRFDQLLFRALAQEIISFSKAAALKNLKVAEFHSLELSMK